MDLKKILEIITLVDLINTLYKKYVAKKGDSNETTNEDEQERFKADVLKDCTKDPS